MTERDSAEDRRKCVEASQQESAEGVAQLSRLISESGQKQEKNCGLSTPLRVDWTAWALKKPPKLRTLKPIVLQAIAAWQVNNFEE